MNYGAQTMNPNNAVAYASPDVRAAFIRRVYSLFFASILVTVGVGSFCAQPSVAPSLLRMSLPLWIGLIVVSLILGFVRRATGLNLFLFFLFSTLWGAVLGPEVAIVNQAAPGVPAEAAWISVSVFGGLSLYAMQSRKDFSYLGGLLFGALIALIVGGFVMFFVHSTLLYTLYCVIGIVIFCGYVLYDTSRILLRLGPDEAVAGAVSIYLDLLNLFLLIMDLLSLRRSD